MSNPLAMRYAGGGSTFDVRRFTRGGSSQSVGTFTGTLETGNNRFSLNRVAVLGNRIVALGNTGIWTKTGAAAFTERVVSMTGNDRSRTGLAYAMLPSGPILFGVTQQSNGEFYKYDYLTDAFTTTLSGVNTLGDANSHTYDTIVVNNVSYTAVHTNMIQVDPSGAGTVTSTSIGVESVGLTSYKDIIYMTARDTTTTNAYRFGRWLGGTFVQDGTITGSQSPSADHKSCIWERNGLIYMVAPGTSATDDGWVMGQWNPDTTTFTDVTSTLFPQSLVSGGGFTGNDDRQWRVYCWKFFDGSSVRTYLQWFFGDTDAGSVVFEHTNTGLALVADSTWTTTISGLSNPHAGGEFYYTENQLNAIQIAPASAATNGLQLDFYANGDAGTADSIVRVYYSVDGNADGFQQATIIAPSGGTGGSSAIVTNALTQVDANGDSGTPTTYSVVHDFTADGLSSSDAIRWKFIVSKT